MAYVQEMHIVSVNGFERSLPLWNFILDISDCEDMRSATLVLRRESTNAMRCTLVGSASGAVAEESLQAASERHPSLSITHFIVDQIADMASVRRYVAGLCVGYRGLMRNLGNLMLWDIVESILRCGAHTEPLKSVVSGGELHFNVHYFNELSGKL